MTLGKADLVRAALAAFAERDFDALLELCTDDVELRSAIIGGADGSAYRGHAEMRSWADEVLETFAVTELFADEIHEVGELVVALGHIHARGGSSGLSLDSPSGWVISIRDGRIASMHGYLDHGSAVQAARAAAK